SRGHVGCTDWAGGMSRMTARSATSLSTGKVLVEGEIPRNGLPVGAVVPGISLLVNAHWLIIMAVECWSFSCISNVGHTTSLSFGLHKWGEGLLEIRIATCPCRNSIRRSL